MKCVRFAIVVVAAMLLAVGAYAQATGSIGGRITDETKAPLPGVTVEISSPNLAEARVVATDPQGRFRVELLPPGTYAVRFTLPGFTTQERTDISVGAGRVVTLQVQMRSAYKEEVSVTGSLIPRPTLEAMSPVTTMDVEQLTYQGNTRLEDLLVNLPQVFSAQNAAVSNGASGTATVNLRNLGDVRTLVLIDGKRMPAGDRYALSPDLNFIPAALVKRVDLLTGGASSVYGADAVAGVVNFVLDTDFEGIKAGISGGGFQHNNDNKEMQGIQAARGYSFPSGQAWDGGQFDAYVAYGRQVRRRQGPCVSLPRLPQERGAQEGPPRLHELLRPRPRRDRSGVRRFVHEPDRPLLHRRRRRLHGGPGDREHVHAVGGGSTPSTTRRTTSCSGPTSATPRAGSSTTSGTSTPRATARSCSWTTRRTRRSRRRATSATP